MRERAGDVFRVMTLNVQMGGEDRMPALLDLLAAERPDLLVLQECLGWEDGERLQLLAERLGIPADPAHAHLGRARPRGSGNRYHVAVVSRRPFQDVRDHADPGRLGHCLVEAHLGGLTVLGAHFDSHGEDQRLAEARYLGEVVPRDALATGRFVLAGDLKALSPRDPYPDDLAERLRHSGTDKYGHPPRFEVVRELEALGWVDALRARPAGEWVTARRDRGGARIDYRTDYVFTSPPLASALRAARVVPTGGASDHEAMLADFDLT